MNTYKLFAALFAASTLVVACSGSDDGKTTDTSGTVSGKSTGEEGSPSGSGKNDGPSSNNGSSGGGSSSGGQTCKGSSLCINGSCKCTEGPKKGASCCYAPESEDDPPCAKSKECDVVCNSCD
jgi:hypothetical protein